jgi:hypothetical protein
MGFPLPPTPPPEATHSSSSLGLVCLCRLSLDSSLESRLGLIVLYVSSPDIASAQIHRKHCFPQFLYCRLTSLQVRRWCVPLLSVSAAVVTWSGSHGNVFTEPLPPKPVSAGFSVPAFSTHATIFSIYNKNSIWVLMISVPTMKSFTLLSTRSLASE